MTNGVDTLSHPVRLGVVGKYLGQLALMLSALTLFPLAASLLLHEYSITPRYLAVIVVLLIFGFATSRLPDPPTVQVNEALTVVALAFVLSPLIMTYPMMGIGLSWLDTLFETVSAVTTTGLSTLSEISNRPRSFLLARAWMQWYGGLGIVVLSVALLMGHHIAARRLTEPASNETLVTTARTHARRMLIVYTALTLFFLLLIWGISGDGFLAITHVLAGVSTGGFSIYDESLNGIDSWPIRYAIIITALSCAIPLPFYYRAWQSGWTNALQDIEFRALLICTILLALILSGCFTYNMSLPWPDALRHAGLIAISAQSTAGFTSLPIADLDNSSKLALILSMLIGGGVGSTAGGFKLLRLLVLLRVLQLLIQRTTLPSHAYTKPHLANRAFEEDDIQRILVLILLFLMVIFISWFAFIVYGYDPLNALFEVVSATGTVGLSSGITATELPAILKLVLCLDMLLGRLEIVAILVVLYPPTWLGKRATT